MQFRKVVCGSDCLELVTLLKKSRFDYHVYGSALLDHHLLLSRDREVRLQHVCREANEHADYGAWCGLSVCDDEVVLPPVSIFPFLARNFLVL